MSAIDRLKTSLDNNSTEALSSLEAASTGVDLTNKKIDFEQALINVNGKLKTNNSLKYYTGIIDSFSDIILSDVHKKNATIFLNNILLTDNDEFILKEIIKLQGILKKYQSRKQSTVDSSKKDLGDMVSSFSINKPIDSMKNILGAMVPDFVGLSAAPNETKTVKAEEYSLFLKSFLDMNQSNLEGTMSTVKSLLDEADSLSEKELLGKITGLWLPFDVETKEWDIYFKQHNIPEENQNKLRLYFSELMENQNFGNLLHSDLGGDIDLEAERILGLKQGEKIILYINGVNPDDISLKFQTKKEALLYLYYNKILFREVATFMEDIIIGTKAVGEGFLDVGSFIANNPILFIYSLMAYIAGSTFGTLSRKINVFLIDKSSGRLGFGQYLNESLSATDGDTSKEAAELIKRNDYIKMLEKRYKGNPDKLKEIKKVKKLIRILDHNIDATQVQEQKIFSLKKEISSKEELLEGVDKKEKTKKKRLKKELSKLKKEQNKLSRDLFRFFEGSFWREIAYIEGSTLTTNRYVDTYLKVLLLNTEGDSISNLDDFNKILIDVQKELFDSTGKPIGLLKEASRYIKRSHNVPNNLEHKIEGLFDEYVRGIKNGELGKIKGNDKKDFIENIKKDFIDRINTDTGLSLDFGIFKEGEGLENAKELFFEGYSDFSQNRGSLKKDEWVKEVFKGQDLDSSTMKEISKFFAEIERGKNEYNQRTALDVVARIIVKDMNYKDAISDSFKNDWEVIKYINIDSDFNGSLENLLSDIESGKYSLDKINSVEEEIKVNETPVEEEDIKVKKSSVEEIKKTDIYMEESSKLQIQNPRQYMINILDAISDKLKAEGYEANILDIEYEKLLRGGIRGDKLFTEGDIDSIFNKIEERLVPKMTSLSGNIDLKIPRTIFDEIKKNGFNLTR